MSRCLIPVRLMAMASPRMAVAIAPPVTERPSLDPGERCLRGERFPVGADGTFDWAGFGSGMARCFEGWMAANEHWSGVPSWIRVRVAAAGDFERCADSTFFLKTTHAMRLRSDPTAPLAGLRVLARGGLVEKASHARGSGQAHELKSMRSVRRWMEGRP